MRRPLLLALAVMSIAGCGGGDPQGRVIVLGLDGMEPSVVDRMIDEGVLPHFRTLREGGAAGQLRSSRPLLSPIIWTTVATGKPPTSTVSGICCRFARAPTRRSTGATRRRCTRFLDVVLRREFWPRAWIESPADLLPITAQLPRRHRRTSSAGQAPRWQVIGAVVAFRRSWPVALLALVVAGNLAALALHGSRHDIFVWHRYYIPSYLVLALLAGLGCDWLIATAAAMAPALAARRPAAASAGRLARARPQPLSHRRGLRREVLASLPPGAHLAASDDNVLFALMYVHLAEGRRHDVDLILQGIGGQTPPPLHFDPDRDGLFFTHHPNWTLPALDVVPVGVVFRVQRAGRPRPTPVPLLDELPGERDPLVPKDSLTRSLIAHFHYMLGFTYAERDWPRARREFEHATAVAPDDDVLFYNLGLLYWRRGLLDEAATGVHPFRRDQSASPRRRQPSAGRRSSGGGGGGARPARDAAPPVNSAADRRIGQARPAPARGDSRTRGAGA